jgi:hypothetical protein
LCQSSSQEKEILALIKRKKDSISLIPAVILKLKQETPLENQLMLLVWHQLSPTVFVVTKLSLLLCDPSLNMILIQ